MQSQELQKLGVILSKLYNNPSTMTREYHQAY